MKIKFFFSFKFDGWPAITVCEILMNWNIELISLKFHNFPKHFTQYHLFNYIKTNSTILDNDQIY